MVFIEDTGGIYDAPLDLVWKLGEAHAKEGNKVHPNTRNNRTEMLNENTFLSSWEEEDRNGQVIKIKVKGTIYYPVGIASEILDGTFSGSKFFSYYMPKDNNNRTAVTVVGDFKSPTISDDEQLKSAVLSFLDKGFDEDVAYLKKMQS